MSRYDKLVSDKPITSVADYKSTIMNINYPSIIMSKLAQTSGDNFESIITSIVAIDGVTSRFMKELENRYNKYKPKPDTFKELKGIELESNIRSLAKALIDNVVNELDKSGSWNEYDLSLKEFYIKNKSFF